MDLTVLRMRLGILVPRVLSYPPYGASVGRVGENTGNEIGVSAADAS